MFEKVNPSHPDKIADRIAGALVDIAYRNQENPRVAVEVLIGHGKCNIIAESSVIFDSVEVSDVVNRICGENVETDILVVPQDEHLAENQKSKMRCGDNGIFKGTPVTKEQEILTRIVEREYSVNSTDGKYILDIMNGRFVCCQSNVNTLQYYTESWIDNILKEIGTVNDYYININPLGEWVGGISVDSGATNRKLGSDMGDSVTGGGLHGKDLSKADVSVNIYAFLKSQKVGLPVEISCAIGDDTIDGKPYSEIVDIARNYIKQVGGFEKFAEWGLIR